MHISEQRQGENERKQLVPMEGVKMKYFLDKKYAVVDHTIINYTGDNVTLKVPEKIDNIVVRSIGEGAFMELPYLQYVRLPSGVTSVGAFAFRSNANLTTVVLPGTIKQIGLRAFHNCKELSEIKLYDFLIDEKEYRDLKNNSIRAADDVYVSRRVPEIPIIKDMIRACGAVPVCIVPDGVNRLFYTNYLPTDNAHQLMYRNTYNICFLDKYSKPISEDEGVMECLKNSNETPCIAKADEVNDSDLRINVHLTPVKTAVFSFHDKETKDIKGKKSLSVTIRIGYFFFQKMRKVICNRKQYYIYQRYYLHYNNNQEFLRRDIAIYTDQGVVMDKKEAQLVYAKYKFLCIL